MQLTSFPSCFQSFSYHPVPGKCSVGHLELIFQTSLQLGTRLFLRGAAASLGPAGCGVEPLPREGVVIYGPLSHLSTCLSRCASARQALCQALLLPGNLQDGGGGKKKKPNENSGNSSVLKEKRNACAWQLSEVLPAHQ